MQTRKSQKRNDRALVWYESNTANATTPVRRRDTAQVRSWCAPPEWLSIRPFARRAVLLPSTAPSGTGTIWTCCVASTPRPCPTATTSRSSSPSGKPDTAHVAASDPSASQGTPRHPPQRRRPAQHRESPATVRPRQPRDRRPPAPASSRQAAGPPFAEKPRLEPVTLVSLKDNASNVPGMPAPSRRRRPLIHCQQANLATSALKPEVGNTAVISVSS